MLSLTLIIGSFLRKSQTTQRDANVEPKICWTCLFHATQANSSGGCGNDRNYVLRLKIEIETIEIQGI